MKRKIAVAIAVAALIGGGAVTAVAAAGEDAPPTSKISATEAMKVALKEVPGSVESAGRDDDDGDWEVDVVDGKGLSHEVRVDAAKGTVTSAKEDDRDDDDKNDRDDAAERSVAKATVDIERATSAALSFRPGTVTEVEYDDGKWEIEIRSKDGSSHDVVVDAMTGKAATHADDDKNDRDDDRDDRDDRDDDRDDRDDRDDDRDDKNDKDDDRDDRDDDRDDRDDADDKNDD